MIVVNCDHSFYLKDLKVILGRHALHKTDLGIARFRIREKISPDVSGTDYNANPVDFAPMKGHYVSMRPGEYQSCLSSSLKTLPKTAGFHRSNNDQL
jgi:hypothetical protein